MLSENILSKRLRKTLFELLVYRCLYPRRLSDIAKLPLLFVHAVTQTMLTFVLLVGATLGFDSLTAISDPMSLIGADLD